MSKLPIWYLIGPFHRYEEDVKSLAKEAGVRIVDARKTDSREGKAEKVPAVTLKGQPKKKEGKAEKVAK